jgi:hypothetical protein
MNSIMVEESHPLPLDDLNIEIVNERVASPTTKKPVVAEALIDSPRQPSSCHFKRSEHAV